MCPWTSIGLFRITYYFNLIYALKRLGKTKGVAALCIGGGEATAIAIEIPA